MEEAGVVDDVLQLAAADVVVVVVGRGEGGRPGQGQEAQQKVVLCMTACIQLLTLSTCRVVCVSCVVCHVCVMCGVSCVCGVCLMRVCV